MAWAELPCSLVLPASKRAAPDNPRSATCSSAACWMQRCGTNELPSVSEDKSCWHRVIFWGKTKVREQPPCCQTCRDRAVKRQTAPSDSERVQQLRATALSNASRLVLPWLQNTVSNVHRGWQHGAALLMIRHGRALPGRACSMHAAAAAASAAVAAARGVAVVQPGATLIGNCRQASCDQRGL